jgi:hypothetical protein
MNEMLFLDDAALRHEPESLRTLLEAHVLDARAATRILAMLLDGARHGEISHCVVVRDSAATSEDGKGVAGWNVKIVYRDERAPVSEPRP